MNARLPRWWPLAMFAGHFAFWAWAVLPYSSPGVALLFLALPCYPMRVEWPDAPLADR